MSLPIDPSVALSQFVGSLPTFIAVLLAWMQSNARISDTNARINDTNARINDLRSELKEIIKAESALLRAEFRRVEEVMDARLKHLEEN